MQKEGQKDADGLTAEEHELKTAVEALSDEERAELKETFTLLDRDGDGFLTVKELGEAMRAMAQHPTEQEIQELARKPTSVAQAAGDKGNKGEEGDKGEKGENAEKGEGTASGEDKPPLTDFDAFLTIMAKRMTVPEADDQLLQAFRVFDKEATGVISASDLRKIVTTLGECLTDEEVEELIREADDDGDGQINYQEFTQLLCSN